MRGKELFILALAFGIMGCASAGKGVKDLRVQQQETENIKLRNELQQKNYRIDSLEGQLQEMQGQKVVSAPKKAKAAGSTGGDSTIMSVKSI